MAAPPFVVKELLSHGWGRMKDNLEIFVPLGLASWFLGAVQASVNRWQGLAVVARWVLAPLLLIISAQLSISWIRAGLRIDASTERPPARLSELFRFDLVQFFNYLIGSLLSGLIVACGLLLLIVPGVVWAIKYSFAPLLIVDQGLDPLSAMRRSAALTAPVRPQLLRLLVVLLLVNILGALALGVGLILSVPTSLVAYCHVYRQLLRAAQG